MATGTGVANYAELKILDHMLGTAEWTMPSALYMALSISPATDTSFIELAIDVNGYSRQLITFSPAVAGHAESSVGVTFGACLGIAWGEVTSFAIYDDDGSPSGNMICYGALGTPILIGIGGKLEFSAGSILINLD